MSFVDPYVTYASKNTDAPIGYHKILGYWLLSAVLERKVVVRLNYGDYYTNIWVFLLGSSTLSRKSTSIKLATKLIPKEANRLPYTSSPQAFDRSLGESGTAHWVTDEGSVILKQMNEVNFMKGLKQALPFLYDCPDYYKIGKMKGDIEIEDVYIPWLCATTQSGLMDNVNVNDITSGFLPRILFVLPPDKNRKWISPKMKSKEVSGEETHLKGRLKALWDFIQKQQEPIALNISDEALDLYDKWLIDWERHIVKKEKYEDYMSAGYGRASGYVVKFATLIHIDNAIEPSGNINETYLRSEITIEEMSKALQIVQRLFEDSREVILNIIGAKESKAFERKFERVLRLIEKRKVTRSEIMQSVGVKAHELNEMKGDLKKEGVKIFYNEQGAEVFERV